MLVTLDGSASTAEHNTPLKYSWILTTKPANSDAALSGATSPAPTFTPDAEGVYVAALIVSDGSVNSKPTTVTVTAANGNSAPVANAGAAQNVTTSTLVTLDGSNSSDVNIGNTLSYHWALISKPGGSVAALSDVTAVKPSFTADVVGAYVANLVVNDGTVDSIAATVTIAAAVGNVAPVANAGPTQNVNTGKVVTLDGSASTDANGDKLTYSWTLTAAPANSTASTATMSGATTQTPTFTADVAGAYVATLVVNDGNLNSTAATVTITATVLNIAPVANAGTAVNAYVGAVVTLNGGASSDANGDALTYSWTITTTPADSYAVLAAATTATPTFHADSPGVYVVTLIVNDGKVNSAAATVPVTLTAATGYITLNGLVWMPVTTATYTWSGANAYCNTTINGQTGWRLPTIAELGGLRTFVSGSIPGQGWTTADLWSSTPGNVYYNLSEIGHWGISIFTGESLVGPDTGYSSVTCVRL